MLREVIVGWALIAGMILYTFVLGVNQLITHVGDVVWNLLVTTRNTDERQSQGAQGFGRDGESRFPVRKP